MNSTDSIRVFSPIILFNDTMTLSIDNELIELKKQKIQAMLQHNVLFWNPIMNKHNEEEEETSSSSSSTIGEKPIKKKNNNGRRRRGNLPKSVTAILKQWLMDHRGHPYPTEEEKRNLRLKTNLTLNQISNWFINARRRILPLILSQEDHLTRKHL